MSGIKLLALLVIMVGVYALYLHSQGKLSAVYEAVISGTVENNQAALSKLAPYGGALIGILIVLSIIPDGAVIPFTAVLVIGAVLYNIRTSPSGGFLKTLGVIQ